MEKEFEEMMVAIKRNVKPSECITNFENLIREINRPEIVDVFISEMSGFISKLFGIFHEVDKLDDLEIKAKILTKNFINPDSYFKKSKGIANRLMRIRAAYEYRDNNKPAFSNITRDADRNKIKIGYKEAVKLVYHATDYSIHNIEDLMEISRKTMLLYHYIPAVYKALIQTKRRSLGLDCNSKRF